MSNTQYAVCHLQRGSGNDSGMSCHIERKDAKREKYVPVNADANRTHLNRELVAFPAGVKNRTDAIQYRIDHAGLHRKVGKNQTKAIRIILTGTHKQMIKMRKKSNNIGEWFLLRSVGDESVDIFFIVRNNSKSLPDEFICDSDHSEFSRLSVLPEPRISLFALGIEPTGRPSGDIEKSSGVCVSVSVDMPFDVYRSSGLFVSGTDTEIAGHLLGILEVSESSGSDDERRGERYAYTFDGCQECELPAELDFDKIREFRLKPVTLLFKELDRFVYGMSCTFVRDRQTCERATKVRHGGNLLSKLANDGSFLSEPQDGLSLDLERTRVHLLSVQGNESCIALIGLDRREHGFGEVLYLQRILHADSNSGDIEHIQQQGAVVPCRLHNTVDTAIFGESPDKLPDTSGRVVKSADFPAFVRGVSYHECSFAHVDSNVLHGRSVFSFKDIAYILVLHCKYGFKYLTNYPDSDVKSMGSEHDLSLIHI